MTGPMQAKAVTLVTGASSGLGREIARLAAADSAVLVLVARRRERLEELAAELAGDHRGLETVVQACDLTDEDQVVRLTEELAGRGLAVDHLVNNAGFGVAGRLHENAPRQETGMVALNAAALHRLLVAFLPAMAERGYGRVLNVASTAAFQPLPYMATYAATKAFVLALSEALWQEVRGTGVTVTCLAPGKTGTEFFEGAQMEGIGFEKVPAADAAAVARAGYRGMLAGERLVVPGLLNKLNAFVSPRSPRRLVLALSGGLFKPGEG